MSLAFEGEHPMLRGDFMSQPTPNTDPRCKAMQGLLVFSHAIQSPE